jgi:Icc-related predicted phosphoesterase
VSLVVRRRGRTDEIFYATDVHGSEICWKKFISGAKFYEAETIILGGDMTGKAIVPIIAQGGGKYKVTLLEQETILNSQEQVDKMARTIQDRGYYPYVTDPDEVNAISNTPGRSDALFQDQVIKTAERWMEYADAKLAGTGIQCYVCPGNDDIFEIDAVIATSKSVKMVEGQVISWTSITRWSSPAGRIPRHGTLTARNPKTSCASASRPSSAKRAIRVTRCSIFTRRRMAAGWTKRPS